MTLTSKKRNFRHVGLFLRANTMVLPIPFLIYMFTALKGYVLILILPFYASGKHVHDEYTPLEHSQFYLEKTTTKNKRTTSRLAYAGANIFVSNFRSKTHETVLTCTHNQCFWQIYINQTINIFLKDFSIFLAEKGSNN